MVDIANHIAAHAVKLARVAVVSAYPITPQTQVIEEISALIEAGEMDCEYIPVESEHSAMAALIGAAAVGVRAFSATSAHGLAYMHELLHWAAGIRLPMVMVNVNRAMGPGWNIWCDHQDAISQRDTGWIQLYCAGHQEIADTVIQAFRISEDPRVILPVMVNYDAFVLSHSYMQADLPGQEEVDRFLPPFRSAWRLDLDNPLTHGSVIYPNDYEEVRLSMQQAHERAREVIAEAAEEYRRIIGRFHGALVEAYRMEDAEYALVAMGSLAAEARVAVDALREEGLAAGLVRVRSYRPFPGEELAGLLDVLKGVLVIDRDISFGMEGALYSDTKAALYGKSQVPVFNAITGLGGRDVPYTVMMEEMRRVAEGKRREAVSWPTIRFNDHHRASREGMSRCG